MSPENPPGSSPPLPRQDGARSGVIAGGNWIVDHVKVIDQWPPEESLARVISQSPHNGGGPYNLLKDLSRLGAPFPLEAVGLLGEDDLGRWIREDCASHGIATAQLQTTPKAATSYTDVMTVQSTGRRTFFHQSGANAHLAAGHFDFGATRARVFYLGYVLLLDSLDRARSDGKPEAATVLERARDAGLLAVLDCVSENSDRFVTHIAPLLPLVDIVFMNEFEAERTTGLELRRDTGIDREAVENAARKLIAMGVRQLAIVHFPHGVCACPAGGDLFWQPSVLVPDDAVAGANGAGDALAAGVLYGIHAGWDHSRALRLGVCAAAASLRHPSCSDAVESADKCLALGDRYGFRT